MAQQQQGPRPTRGSLHSTPCTHCQRPMDFRDMAPTEGIGWGNAGLETGAQITCDHCGRLSEIKGIQELTVITLVPR